MSKIFQSRERKELSAQFKTTSIKSLELEEFKEKQRDCLNIIPKLKPLRDIVLALKESDKHFDEDDEQYWISDCYCYECDVHYDISGDCKCDKVGSGEEDNGCYEDQFGINGVPDDGYCYICDTRYDCCGSCNCDSDSDYY